jgi:hypothetical protein
MLTRRSLAAVFAAVGLCACVPSHYTPVPACPIASDGSHPSTGPLEVLPSEVPGLELDSMRWYVHTGHEGEEFGTYTSMSAVGRIVSTKETSLVGVGVLVEGIRDGVVVHRMIDSNFYESRQVPLSPQLYQLITRETVRPDRPVAVAKQEKVSGRDPAGAWGCPARVRIVRLSPPGAPVHLPQSPEDERPMSDFYAWNPRTFSVDTIMLMPPTAIALLRGREGDTARTDVVVVLSKILYRRFERDGIRADSSRIDRGELTILARERDSAATDTSGRRWLRGAAPPTSTPGPGETILIVSGTLRHEWRFATANPPPALAPLIHTMARIGHRMAPTAR